MRISQPGWQVDNQKVENFDIFYLNCMQHICGVYSHASCSLKRYLYNKILTKKRKEKRVIFKINTVLRYATHT